MIDFDSDEENTNTSLGTEVSVSAKDLLRLFSMQTADINSEAGEQFEKILDIFSSLFSTINTQGIDSQLKNDCMRIIQLLQYSDKLQQRLQHLEEGIRLVCDSLDRNECGKSEFLSAADSKHLLMSITSLCRMEHEQAVINKFVQQLEFQQSSNDSEMHT